MGECADLGREASRKLLTLDVRRQREITVHCVAGAPEWKCGSRIASVDLAMTERDDGADSSRFGSCFMFRPGAHLHPALAVAGSAHPSRQVLASA